LHSCAKSLCNGKLAVALQAKLQDDRYFFAPRLRTSAVHFVSPKNRLFREVAERAADDFPGDPGPDGTAASERQWTARKHEEAPRGVEVVDLRTVQRIRDEMKARDITQTGSD